MELLYNAFLSSCYFFLYVAKNILLCASLFKYVHHIMVAMSTQLLVEIGLN